MHRILGLLALAAALTLQWEPSKADFGQDVTKAHARGQIQARSDLARGKFSIKTHGLRPKWYDEYERLLYERYDVTVDTIGGCTIDWEKEGFAAGYDSVVEAYLLEKFGKDIFKECRDDAERAYRETLEARRGDP